MPGGSGPEMAAPRSNISQKAIALQSFCFTSWRPWEITYREELMQNGV